MAHNPLGNFLGVILLPAFLLSGCTITNQDIRQELQDESRGFREQMARGEKSYEHREYLGLTSKESENWNSTDWSMWMDAHGGR